MSTGDATNAVKDMVDYAVNRRRCTHLNGEGFRQRELNKRAASTRAAMVKNQTREARVEKGTIVDQGRLLKWKNQLEKNALEVQNTISTTRVRKCKGPSCSQTVTNDDI